MPIFITTLFHLPPLLPLHHLGDHVGRGWGWCQAISWWLPLLKLRNSIWALILPMALSPFNVICGPSSASPFLNPSLNPLGLTEQANLDFPQIVPTGHSRDLQLSLSAAIGFWNDWFSALLYLDDQKPLPTTMCDAKSEANIDYIVKNAAQGLRPVSGRLYSRGKQRVWPWWLSPPCQSP